MIVCDYRQLSTPTPVLITVYSATTVANPNYHGLIDQTWSRPFQSIPQPISQASEVLRLNDSVPAIDGHALLNPARFRILNTNDTERERSSGLKKVKKRSIPQLQHHPPPPPPPPPPTVPIATARRAHNSVSPIPFGALLSKSNQSCTIPAGTSAPGPHPLSAAQSSVPRSASALADRQTKAQARTYSVKPGVTGRIGAWCCTGRSGKR